MNPTKCTVKCQDINYLNNKNSIPYATISDLYYNFIIQEDDINQEFFIRYYERVPTCQDLKSQAFEYVGLAGVVSSTYLNRVARSAVKGRTSILLTILALAYKNNSTRCLMSSYSAVCNQLGFDCSITSFKRYLNALRDLDFITHHVDKGVLYIHSNTEKLTKLLLQGLSA